MIAADALCIKIKSLANASTHFIASAREDRLKNVLIPLAKPPLDDNLPFHLDFLVQKFRPGEYRGTRVCPGIHEGVIRGPTEIAATAAQRGYRSGDEEVESA